MAKAALDRFGAIDVLINNASLMSVLPRRSWLEIPVDEWDRVMAVNLRGTFLCCRAVFPAMKAQQRGKIVNISSSRFFEGTPNRLHYTTSKAGVVGFTRALAREVGEFGITVNAVAPGHDRQRHPGVVDLGQLPRRALVRPRHRSGAGAGRPGRRGDVPVLAGERFHDRPDAAGRRRQDDALMAPDARHSTERWTAVARRSRAVSSSKPEPGNSLERMVGVLDLFEESPSGWTFDRIHSRLGYTRSTLYRYLKILSDAELADVAAGGRLHARAADRRARP